MKKRGGIKTRSIVISGVSIKVFPQMIPITESREERVNNVAGTYFLLSRERREKIVPVNVREKGRRINPHRINISDRKIGSPNS